MQSEIPSPRRSGPLALILLALAAGFPLAAQAEDDAANSALPGYPDGLLVTQNGYNVSPSENQNVKFVSWTDVVTALELD